MTYHALRLWKEIWSVCAVAQWSVCTIVQMDHLGNCSNGTFADLHKPPVCANTRIGSKQLYNTICNILWYFANLWKRILRIFQIKIPVLHVKFNRFFLYCRPFHNYQQLCPFVCFCSFSSILVNCLSFSTSVRPLIVIVVHWGQFWNTGVF